MNKIFDENTRAIIIAIENYRFEKISKVRYAINDAENFKQTLIDNFGIKKENIKTFYDSDASKTALEDDIKYEIKQLNKDERFIFYYVGHGFFEGNSNKISAFDSSPMNYSDTTISLKEVLIDPLSNSDCKKSLIFLDTCSQSISSMSIGRSSISNINQNEFDKLLKESEYCATFLSCSPGEKSYSDDNLKHGIWTFHLLKALSGKEKSVLIDNKYITDTSLRDYLRKSIPQFIAKNTDIKGTQTPTSNISASSSFLISEVTEFIEETDKNSTYPSLAIKLDEYKINSKEVFYVTNAKGYKDSHFIPKVFNSSSESYIQGILLTN